MPTDLELLRNLVAIGKDFATGLSAVIAATVAVIGLTTWQRQLRGRTEYKLARRFLNRVYRVRQLIQALRHPFVSSGETMQALQEIGAATDGFDPHARADQALGQRAVYHRRWENFQEAYAELKAEAIEAKVLWGDAVDERLRTLDKLISELFAAVTSYLRRQERPDRAQPPRRESERFREVNEVLFNTGEDNAFTQRLDEAIDALVELARPHLEL